MHTISRVLVLTFTFSLFFLTSSFAILAQEQTSDKTPETGNRESYEIVLQILKSANSDEKNNQIPDNLQPIVKKLRSNFGAGDYNLMLTLLNRVSERGNLEIKAVNPFNQQQTDVKSLGFYDLTLNGIRPARADEITVDFLRFGIRVPVLTYAANNGNSLPETRYEQLGITARPLSVAINEPTVVGTLTTARPNELLVLVLTVKPENRPVAKKN